jgi:hypothetical protein
MNTQWGREDGNDDSRTDAMREVQQRDHRAHQRLVLQLQPVPSMP